MHVLFSFSSSFQIGSIKPLRTVIQAVKSCDRSQISVSLCYCELRASKQRLQ